jgi:hypothetical protein
VSPRGALLATTSKTQVAVKGDYRTGVGMDSCGGAAGCSAAAAVAGEPDGGGTYSSVNGVTLSNRGVPFADSYLHVR